MAEGETQFETFTPSERAYFDSRGEKPVETEAPAEIEREDSDEGEDLEGSEVEAKEEAETEDKAPEEEERPKKSKDQRVPLRKLQEEVNARRELEKKNAELAEQFARADERLRLLFEARQPKQEEVNPPNPTDDPIGFMEWQKAEVERLANEQRQTQESYQREQQINALDSAYKQSFAKTAAEKPDIADAYQHYIKVTELMLTRRGFSGQQLVDQIHNEERRVAAMALQNGVSPADWIYEDAMAMGYQPKAKEVEQASKAEAEIERRQKAAPAARSLSTAGGSRGGNIPTAAELAKMPEEEFYSVLEKLSPSQKRQIMGG